MALGEQIPIKTRREVELMREATGTSPRSCSSSGASWLTA
jgi:hypothetical protein